MKIKKSVLMTLNHNCGCSNESVTGIAGNAGVFAKGWNSRTSVQQQQMPGFANG